MRERAFCLLENKFQLPFILPRSVSFWMKKRKFSLQESVCLNDEQNKNLFCVSLCWCVFFLLFSPNQKYGKLKEKAEKILHTHKKFTTNWFFFLNSFFFKLIMLKTEKNGTFFAPNKYTIPRIHSDCGCVCVCVCYNTQWQPAEKDGVWATARDDGNEEEMISA